MPLYHHHALQLIHVVCNWLNVCRHTVFFCLKGHEAGRDRKCSWMKSHVEKQSEAVNFCTFLRPTLNYHTTQVQERGRDPL